MKLAPAMGTYLQVCPLAVEEKRKTKLGTCL